MVARYVPIDLGSFTEPITIIPWGDIHRDSKLCAHSRWKEWKDQQKDLCAKGGIRRYVCMGDPLDFVATGERRKISALELHDDTNDTLDDMMRSRVEALAEEIHWMRGMFLGGVAGNHTWKFQDGTTSDGYLCQLLEGVWLGTLAILSLSLTWPNTKKAVMINIVATHGRAGGKLRGTSINQVADLVNVFPTGHLFLAGHDHQLGAFPEFWLEPSSAHGGARTVESSPLRIVDHPRVFVRTGSFRRAYVPNIPDYVVKSLLRPAAIGAPEIRIRLVRESHKEQNGKRVDRVCPRIQTTMEV